MNNVSYFERGKEPVEKGGLRALGIAFGVLTLLAAVGALFMLIGYPLLIDKNAPNVIELYKAVFSTKAKETIIYGALSIAVILGTLAYVIANAVKMISSKMERSGNVKVAFKGGLGVFFFWTISAFCATASLSGLGIDVFLYATVGAIVLQIIFDFVTLVYARKFWEKSGKKLNTIAIISIIACILAIASGVIYYAVDFSNLIDKANLAYTYDLYTMPSAVDYLILLVATIFSGAGFVDILFAVLMGVTALATFVFAGRLVFSFIANFFKLGADRNYVRGSKYFSSTSALRTAGGFAFTNFFGSLIVAVYAIVNGASVGDALKLLDLFYAIIFVIVLILCIVCSVLACKDKKKATDEMYEYGTVELEEVVDLADEEKEEVVAEVVEDDAKDEFITYGEEEEKVEEPIVYEPVVFEEYVPVEEPVQAEEQIQNEEKEEEKEMVENKEDVVVEEQPRAKKNRCANSCRTCPYYPMNPAMNPYCNPYGQMAPQYPYAPAPYPIYPQYPYPVYPQAPVAPTVIYIPFGGQPVAPVQPATPAQVVESAPTLDNDVVGDIDFGAQPVAPVQEIVEAPVEPVVEEPVEEEVVEEAPLVIERKTIEEKYNELPANLRKYYREIMKYAETKDGVKRNKATYADSAFYGRDCIIKVQIKQGKIVCNFSLLNYEVKSMLKNGKGAKAQNTVIKVVDETTFETAKQSIDMAYKLAIEAKEERHQEQLRKRREARAAKLAAKA